MEETLYNIEIHKDNMGYIGKLFSDMDGIKEFKNEYLDKLLRDITIDMQLALEEFSNRTAEYVETQEIVKKDLFEVIGIPDSSTARLHPRRHDILETALDLFGQQGYQGTTMTVFRFGLDFAAGKGWLPHWVHSLC